MKAQDLNTIVENLANAQKIETLKAEISSLQQQITPLTKRLHEHAEELRSLEGKEFIRVNKIKREDVEMSEGKGKPYFGNISVFIGWMRSNTKKNWAEWNTRIYRTSDLLVGRMSGMPATIDDL